MLKGREISPEASPLPFSILYFFLSSQEISLPIDPPNPSHTLLEHRTHTHNWTCIYATHTVRSIATSFHCLPLALDRDDYSRRNWRSYTKVLDEKCNPFSFTFFLSEAGYLILFTGNLGDDGRRLHFNFDICQWRHSLYLRRRISKHGSIPYK